MRPSRAPAHLLLLHHPLAHHLIDRRFHETGGDLFPVGVIAESVLYAVNGILQSSFRPASRRETFGSALDEITTGRKFVSLTDFIERFDWEYSDLDIVDRREIKHLAADNFWRYIGKSEVPLEEPGHLSAVTVAKGIEYGVNLLGCFIEGYVGSNQALGKEAEAHFGKMTQAALECARGSFATCSEEHNWYEHFQLLMRHPVINAGVRIAAWHHYRLPEDLLSI